MDTGLKIIPYLNKEERMETGPIQFGTEDWPGIFIRGDNALYFAKVLDNKLNGFTDSFTDLILKNLVKTLGSCIKKNERD